MTLVIALTGKNSIWLAADRRLTWMRQRTDKTWDRQHTDNARKVVSVEAANGVALLGYSGLGATLLGNQPSDWMHALLVDRPNLTVEQALSVIADAMQAEMPKHLRQMPDSQAHHVLAPALIGVEPRLYSIHLETRRGGKPTHFAWTRHIAPIAGNRPPRLGVAGSGFAHLPPVREWSRGLLRLLAKHEQGRIGPEHVADRLAEIIHKVSVKDKLVSSRCIVTWRSERGGSMFYASGFRTAADRPIPAVSNGMDISTLLEATMQFSQAFLEAFSKGEPSPDPLKHLPQRVEGAKRFKLR